MSSVKVHVTMDESLLKRVDALAAEEHRSRSELIREAIRTYGRRPEGAESVEAVRARARAVLREVAGAWSAEDHPETESLEAGRSPEETRARALAVLEELAEADFGAEDLPEPDEFPGWRERLWAGNPRYGAADE